jgi:hypothetical protein
MSDWLLAGPILRRVTTKVVCVWLVSNQKHTLKLSVMKGTALLGQSDIKLLDQQRCQLGKQLFIYLLQAKPIAEEGDYPNDTLLSYRVDQVNDQSEVMSTINAKALKITYGNSTHPTFFIPKKLEKFLHGSCRKPHGHLSANDFNYDALALADDELNKTHKSLTDRPAILLMTGDQIYADDVADSVFALILKKGIDVLGFSDQLPFTDTTDQNFLTVDQVGGRKKLTKKSAGFSTEEGKNHLFRFCEFAAMYIYVFGNAQNWALDYSHETDAVMRSALQEFHNGLPKVRRLFANIPTYMIFDDHDVTDDWNITSGWYDRVRDKPLGHRIVSNALAAYWAFQGWGNDPDNFDYDVIRAVIDYLATANPSVTVTNQYDLITWKHRGWGYSVPTNPPVLVLDSRTQRVPDGDFYPTQLMDRYALDWLRIEWLALKAAQENEAKEGKQGEMLTQCPIIVAATPVMGLAPIEWFSQFLLWLTGTLEDTLPVRFLEKLADAEGFITGYIINLIDAEAWISNRDGYRNFLTCVLNRMEINQCVFLSGDVHYSFSAKATFDNQGKKLECWQLTSSSLCNEPNAQQRRILNKIRRLDRPATHKNWALRSRKRWQAEIQYLADTEVGLRVLPQCNIGLVEFKDGLPVKHSLLTLNAAKVFDLQ